MSTPTSYLQASWRCTLPVDADGRMGIGLNLADGTVVRVSLDMASAQGLAETVLQYIDQAKSAAGSQSPMSELSPSSPRSVPSEGENV